MHLTVPQVMATVGMAVGLLGHYHWRYNWELGRGGEGHEEGIVDTYQVPFLFSLIAGSLRNSRLVWFILPELAVFLLEDCTTIFIWSMTGTFDGSNVAAVNLVATILSAAVIVVLLICTTVAFFRSEYGGQDEDARTFLILVIGSIIIVAFFGYTAIGEIGFGDSTGASGFFAEAGFDGSGSAEGGGSADPPTDALGISDGLLTAVKVFYGIGCTLGAYMALMIRGATMVQWKTMPCFKRYDLACECCCNMDSCCCDAYCSCKGCCKGPCMKPSMLNPCNVEPLPVLTLTA